MNYKVSHPTKEVICELTLPSSKSISNRLLIIQHLCDTSFQIHNLSNSEDTLSLKNALNSTVDTIDVGAAGTSFRFLTAFLANKEGEEFILTGSKRMQERPIKDLVESLLQLGSDIEYVNQVNFPPLRIKGKNISGGNIQIEGGISSQFISALLLIAPTLKNGINLSIVGELVSKPYVEMTLRLMEEFGISYSWTQNTIQVNQQKYKAKDYIVESDWSAASFWFEIASLSKKCDIKLKGLSENSIQGDKNLMDLYEQLGVHSYFVNETLHLVKKKSYENPEYIDLLGTPDLYQPIKCTLFGLAKSSKFTGVITLKDKETDRIKAVEEEILKLDSIKIIHSHKDHRMAMSFAPLCLRFGELQINNIEVVKKSYPDFWKDIQKGGFKITPLIQTNN
ncbi:MAG: 3-phosphoshikimate 1-carboxyvinyltransferase [Flavobacteriales bacterium]|nr:3-phosphoshikimate 1-carboxyvinyltransferase [Flavobacteriales bacterium]|tara:strand:- start:4423 stop:5604 length:1182 start_codon:yes stop_codon:yes gene_type:complete